MPKSKQAECIREGCTLPAECDDPKDFISRRIKFCYDHWEEIMLNGKPAMPGGIYGHHGAS